MSDWDVARVCDVCEQVPVGTKYSKEFVQDHGRTKVIDQSQEGIFGWHDNAADIHASPESPVFTFANHTCSMRWMDEPFSVIQNVFPMRGIPGKTDTRFLYYASGASVVQDGYKGHFPQFRESIIQIPPLPEQKKIAEILSGIDKCIVQTKLRIQKQNLINESLLSGIEYLRGDKFAKHEATIGDISSKVGSGITPRGGSETYESEGITFIRSQNVLRMRLSLDDAVRIPQHIHDSMSGTRVLPQDVLLNITGASIGRSAVVPDGIGEANVNQHVCIIRTTGMCDPLFLCGWLNSKSGQIAINSSQAGGNRQGLNFEQIKAMSIPLPPIHLQKKISTALQASNIHTQSLQARFDWLLNLKSAVSSDLLSGRKRVSV